jgi:hypothetical protein
MNNEDVVGVHMLLPRSLVGRLDEHKTRYQSRTSLVVRAIEDFLTKMELQDEQDDDQTSDWIIFKK